MRLKFVLTVLLLIILGAAATAEEIRIVAAADLNYVFRDIAARFAGFDQHRELHTCDKAT